MNNQSSNPRQQLTQVYTKWIKELQNCAPALISGDYSNPYYTSIPEGWFETTGPRIMIVGEEGFGKRGCGKRASLSKDEDAPFYTAEDIEDIQQITRRFFSEQFDVDNQRKSPFWNRFRRVAKYGACCWTNIDKIHRLDNKRCALRKKERILLHSTNTRILAEEISILKPTHIVFFGWYGISLQHELPELFSKLYPGGLKDESVWKESKIVPFDCEQYKALFLYHPAWGNRNKWYEPAVDEALEVLFSS